MGSLWVPDVPMISRMVPGLQKALGKVGGALWIGGDLRLTESPATVTAPILSSWGPCHVLQQLSVVRLIAYSLDLSSNESKP